MRTFCRGRGDESRNASLLVAREDDVVVGADNDPLIRSQAQYMALLEESLSAAEAAKLLRVDVSRVRQRLQERSANIAAAGWLERCGRRSVAFRARNVSQTLNARWPQLREPRSAA